MNLQQINHIVAERAFPDVAFAPQVKETHISWIILSDNFAFKIKKPVAFSFVDLSAMKFRRYACRREILLNNRCSTGVYLGRIAVRKDGDRIEIGGTRGEVIDWAVQMNRLDSALQLDEMLAAGEVKLGHMIMLGQHIAHCHRLFPAVKIIPKLSNLQQRVSEVFDPISDYEGKEWTRMIHAGKRLVPVFQKFLADHYEQLSQRARDGYVLDGHGDLHCGNIFMYDPPILFDCLDFCDELRQVDVLDELAFLVMDLEARGENRLADLLLNTYLEHNHCLKAEVDLNLFYYFKAYRAAVRAKVNLLHTGKAQQLRADRYLDLMECYADQFIIRN